MKTKLGKLECVEIRKVWKLETDFSDWLVKEDQMEELGKAVDLELTDAKREKGVGDFRADILAVEERTDRRVIIENQYGKTNHDHLGKLITYAAGTGAKTIIWVVEEARDEYRAAVQWLNDVSSEEIGFFLVKITVLRIGSSEPAPQFTVLERPNEWSKSVRGLTAAGQTEGVQEQQKFFAQFMDYGMSDKAFSSLFNRRKALCQNWMDLPCGSSVYWISLSAIGWKKKNAKVSVSIYIGDDKAQYEVFESHKEEIEKDLGFPLTWMAYPDKKASRIKIEHEADWSDEPQRTECIRWMTATAVEFRKIFPKYDK